MRKNAIRSESIFALFSILSLLYVYYYATVFYYRSIGTVFDFLYEFIAVPAFYFFVATFIVTLLSSLFSFRGVPLIQNKLKQFIAAVLVAYALFVVLKKSGVIVLLPILFGTAYCAVYFVMGCLYALAIAKPEIE